MHARLPKGRRVFAVYRYRENTGELAAQFDMKSAVIRHETDFIDERADELESFIARARVAQRLV